MYKKIMASSDIYWLTVMARNLVHVYNEPSRGQIMLDIWKPQMIKLQAVT